MWLTVLTPPAHACLSDGPVAYVVSDEAALVDHEPPAAPRVVSVGITRSPDPIYHREPDGSCMVGTSSCDGIGWVEIVVEPPVDDQSPSDDLGYRVIPSSRHLRQPVQFLAAPEGSLFWTFEDDPLEPIDASFQVVAVDRAGNESAPSEVVEWSDPGRAPVGPCGEPESGSQELGCGVGGAAAWVGPVALGLRRRRR